ncbi:MAG TPA: HNH endonuclease [Clostridiaceae bacterium]
MVIIIKICKICGKEFDRKINRQKCCSDECSKINKAQYDKEKHARYKLEKPKYKKICPSCGLDFETILEKSICCSEKCAALISNNKIEIKKCLNCGKEFNGKRGNLYCSSSCKNKYRESVAKYTHKCIFCGKEFKSNAENRTYCSNKCFLKDITKHKAICEHCGKEFVGKNKRPNRFCSRKCFCQHLGFEDKNMPKYKSVVSDMQHIKKAKKFHVEYEHMDPLDLYEKDNWKCAICGEKIDKNLYYPNPMSASIDHIIPFTKGGTHTKGNVRATHLRCNIIRGNKLIESKNGQLRF